jgi:hypothetical protein
MLAVHVLLIAVTCLGVWSVVRLRIKRAILIGPMACTLIGLAAGICQGMLSYPRYWQRDDVDYAHSSPLLVRGDALGCLVGLVIFAIGRRWPRVLPALTVLVATLLGAAVVAPNGWKIGAEVLVSIVNRYPRGQDLSSVRWLFADGYLHGMQAEGMLIGAVLGALLGLAVGLLQVRFDRRCRSSQQHIPPVRPHLKQGWAAGAGSHNVKARP